MRPIEFYQEHLDRVSRSFAFCIRKLEPPFRQWVSLAYLLCRALDTIEDSPWENREVQARQYSAFESFLERCPESREIPPWAAFFPSSIPENEKLLLADCHALFEDLHELPPGVRDAMTETVGKMRRGMQYYSERALGGNELRLTDLTDVNRYCYFVAGVVGELLTELFLAYRPDFAAPEEFRQNGLHFGLFLQKINLLKDQPTDEPEGRFLIPDRAVVLASLRRNAEGALQYLLALPQDPGSRGYRTFCAWSLFLGAASLPFLEQNYHERDGAKISRSVTQELLATIEAISADNGALRSAFDESFHLLGLPEAEPALARAADPGAGVCGDSGWFLRLAGPGMSCPELLELGMA